LRNCDHPPASMKRNDAFPAWQIYSATWKILNCC
jgi:hypothetical protein